MKKRLGDAIRAWIYDYKRLSVKQATNDRLNTSCDLLTKYKISDIFPDELSTDDIQGFLNALVHDGYSDSTVKKEYTLLTAYLKHAISFGEVSKPVYLGVSMPSQNKGCTNGIRAFTLEEQAELDKVLDTLRSPIYGLAILMLESGIRVGEALALTWDDIQWNRRAISVNKTWVRLVAERREFIQKSAKSRTSNRVIPMSQRAAMTLDRLGRLYGRDGYIFHDALDQSKPASYSAVRYHLREACDKAGVLYKGTHAFRHTFATNCYYKGCDVKILSKLLGHADVAITYNVYIHLFGDALEEMRKVIS